MPNVVVPVLVIIAAISGAMATYTHRESVKAAAVPVAVVRAVPHVLFKCEGGTPSKCIVRQAPGGNVMEHIKAANLMAKAHKMLEIDGMCASACTIVADVMAKDDLVCVTPNALLLFHSPRFLATTPVGVGLMKLNYGYGGKLGAWINEHGGLPWDGWLRMEAADAVKIFPSCPAPPPPGRDI